MPSKLHKHRLNTFVRAVAYPSPARLPFFRSYRRCNSALPLFAASQELKFLWVPGDFASVLSREKNAMNPGPVPNPGLVLWFWGLWAITA